jgi:Protein of unknown function (DUF4238)
MNEPIDQHYLPVFYLSRWTGSDGLVCRFSKPNGHQIKAKRIAPKGTAFEANLYDFGTGITQEKHSLEREFLSPLDSGASQSLGLLESGITNSDWLTSDRDNWSRFIVAQMFRAPEDITQLKSSVSDEWKKSEADLEAKYAARRTAFDPSTIRDYLENQHPDHLDEFTKSVAKTVMEHRGICELVSNMHWQLLKFPNDASPLFTSDRPVWTTATLTEDEAFIMMPIGPHSLFTASINRQTSDRLRAHDKVRHAKVTNKITVQHAVRFVYSINDDLLSFVQKHFATRRHSTPLERLAASRGHKVISPDSPLA